MKTLIHPAPSDFSLHGVLYALGDPTRLQMVRCLAQTGSACCGSLTQNLPKSTLTRHFRVLRENGIIAQEVRGRKLVNSLRLDELNARFPGLMNAILEADSFQNRRPKSNKTQTNAVQKKSSASRP